MKTRTRNLTNSFDGHWKRLRVRLLQRDYWLKGQLVKGLQALEGNSFAAMFKTLLARNPKKARRALFEKFAACQWMERRDAFSAILSALDAVIYGADAATTSIRFRIMRSEIKHQPLLWDQTRL